MGDLDFEGTASSNGAGLDIFDSDFATAPPPEAEFGRQPLPNGEHYHFVFTKAEVRLAKSGTPMANLGIKVITGPEGTVGRVEFVTAAMGYGETRTDRATGETTERTDEQKAKAKAFIKKEWERAIHVLEFAQRLPEGSSVEAKTAWLQQMVGKEAVGEIRVETFNGRKQNKVPLISLRKPGEPAKDSTGKLNGKTALDMAKEFAANYGKRTGKRGSGLTARDLGGARRDEFA